MAKIGNFGKLITFETSDAKVLNFNDFQRTCRETGQSMRESERNRNLNS